MIGANVIASAIALCAPRPSIHSILQGPSPKGRIRATTRTGRAVAIDRIRR